MVKLAFKVKLRQPRAAITNWYSSKGERTTWSISIFKKGETSIYNEKQEYHQPFTIRE